MDLAEHNSLLCYNSNTLSLDNFSLQKAVLFWFLWRLSLRNQISFYFILDHKNKFASSKEGVVLDLLSKGQCSCIISLTGAAARSHRDKKEK